MRSVSPVALVGAALVALAGSALGQERSVGPSLLAATPGEPMLMQVASPRGRPMATLPNTEVRSLRSRFTGDAYDIYVFPRELGARVFLTVGGEETELLSPFDQFCRQLRSHAYRGLDLTVLKADGQVHETAAFVNLPTVLRRLYRP